MKFLVRYNAHIVENKRPKDENFPSVLVVNHVYDAPTDEILGNLINGTYQDLISSPGVTFFRDPTNIRPSGTGNVTNRFFLPWHMVAYMDVFVTPITEEKPPEQTLIPPVTDPIPEVQGPVH